MILADKIFYTYSKINRYVNISTGVNSKNAEITKEECRKL